jgi:Uma2 family endonuclease
MATYEPLIEVEYPESDGKPMAETDVHRDWMVRLIELLRERYRGQRVYVSGNLLMYYEEGNPKKFVSPDAFVVKECDPGRRRIFKTWAEGRTPDVVFEVTSKSTRREDRVTKPQIYALLGVKEYFSYDPLGEYLKPPLKGFRLHRKSYRPIEADTSGALKSQELGALIRLEKNRLELYDLVSGERLLTEAEAALQTAATERKARLAAEKENRRLRKLLQERGEGK